MLHLARAPVEKVCFFQDNDENEDTRMRTRTRIRIRIRIGGPQWRRFASSGKWVRMNA